MTVLRLGHRPKRDVRVSTHLLLAARAFGAKEAIYTGIRDRSLEETIRKVVEDWGGGFQLTYVDSWRREIKGWDGKVVHLTMYGLPVSDIVSEIRSDPSRKLVVVGGAKVPGEVFRLAHWNVAVTSQPHSEVSALAVFLNELSGGSHLGAEFPGARMRIVPQVRGKLVVTAKEEISTSGLKALGV